MKAPRLSGWEAIGLALAVAGVVSPSAGLLVLALMRRMNEDCKCWPSDSRLARDTGLGSRTVRRLRDALKAEGFVEWSKSHGKTNTYEVDIGALRNLGQSDRGHPDLGHTGQTPRPERPDTSATVADRTRLKESAQETAQLSPPQPKDPEPVEAVPDVAWWFDQYNSVADEFDLSSVKKITSDRLSSVRARLAEHGRDGLEGVLKEIRRSDFLQGKTGNSWRPNADWLIKPQNFLKVLEGQYRNQSNSLKPTQSTRTLGRDYDVLLGGGHVN